MIGFGGGFDGLRADWAPGYGVPLGFMPCAS